MIFTLCFLQSAPCHADIWSGLVGYWKFDEASSGTCAGATVVDASNHGNTGTCSGSPTYVAGKIGKGAMSFNSASSQYVNMGNQSTLDFTTGSFSYTSWFKSSAINTFTIAKVLSLNASGYDMLIGAGGVAGNIRCRVHSGNDIRFTVDWVGTNDGKWHQADCVVDRVAHTLSLYGDGILQGTPVSISGLGSVSTIADFQIAARSGATFYAGNVDDVRIYNRALSAADVSMLYLYGTVTLRNSTWRNFKTY